MCECHSGSALQEAKKVMAVAGKVNVTPPLEEKANDEEPLVFANKQVLS